MHSNWRVPAIGRVFVTVALAMAALGAAAAPASAGTYSVRQCNSTGSAVGIGSPPDQDWQDNQPAPAFVHTNNCLNATPGLIVTNGSLVDPVPDGLSGTWTLDAPGDTVFTSFSGVFESSLSNGFVRAAKVLNGATIVASLPAGNPATLSHTGAATQVSVRLECPSGGPDCGISPTSTLTGRDFAYTLNDQQVPGAPVLGGTLFGGGWLRGTVQGTWSATDAGGGVRRANLQISGQPDNVDAASCAINPNDMSSYSRKVPCPTQASGAFTLNSTALADGQHVANVVAADVGDNEATTSTNLRVDNTPPGPPLNIHLTSQTGDRVNVAWGLPPQAPGSPIAAYRYKLGSAPTSPGDGQLVQSGSLTGLGNLQIPAGTSKLYVWLRDEAGNTGDPTKAAAIDLTFTPPTGVGGQGGTRCLINGEPTVPKATLLARFKNLKNTARSMTLPFGKRVRVRGRLTASTGTAIRNAKVRAFIRYQDTKEFIDRGGTRTRQILTLSHGNFTYIAPIGAARTVRFTYFNCENSTAPIATAFLALKVRAALQLRVDRIHHDVGDSVGFHGRLLGQPFPTKSIQIAIQRRGPGGGRWQTVGHADTRGNHFETTLHPLGASGKYSFRAVLHRQKPYPYETGHSAPIKVVAR